MCDRRPWAAFKVTVVGEAPLLSAECQIMANARASGSRAAGFEYAIQSFSSAAIFTASDPERAHQQICGLCVHE
jgi:hypothetical protein